MEDPVQPEGPVGLSVIHNSFPGVSFDVNIYALNPPKKETKVNFSSREEFQQLASKKKTSTGDLQASRRRNTNIVIAFTAPAGIFWQQEVQKKEERFIRLAFRGGTGQLLGWC